MPLQGRVRSRPVTNENDENTGTTRLTRAKAAALVTDEPSVNVLPAKKPLQSKKSASNTLSSNAPPTQQKRAALGDVSNVTKAEPTEGKETKKVAGTVKRGLVSKASQNAGVQKTSRANAARPILASKDNNNKKTTATELKRSASGSGVMGGVPKKRNTSSASSQQSIKEADDEGSLELPTKKTFTAAPIKQDVTEPATKITTVKTEQKVVVEQIVESVPTAASDEVQDLDHEDLEDPLMVAEYVVEIFDYLKTLEETTLPNANYMEHQDDLEWKMRGILVDWLIEVHARFRLAAETLFLAVNIIDRFLSSKVVQLDRLQLVGVTALFIASKYEDVINPDVAHLRHVADDGFSEQEILSAERYVLGALNYDLSYPNPMNFLRRISKADDYDIQTRTIGKYLMEISLLDHRFMEYRPSHVAAASMYLSRLILDRGEWHPTIAHYSGYTEKEIEPVFKLMVDYLAKPVAHEAFFKKYASKKFLKASILARQWAKKYAACYGVDASQSTAGSR
ncbi:MAG: G2/mitotic-specific cyclin [Piccolia ochrophora]|nr:MAG: G2/mitotic-specific cyclin [Piccolia ochrophora]